MGKIHGDRHGVYVRLNGSINRPYEGHVSALAELGLAPEDSSILEAYRYALPSPTQYSKGTSGIPTKHVPNTPLATVGVETWLADGLTPYNEWDWAKLPNYVAHMRVARRVRLGEAIPMGAEWRAATEEELLKLAQDTTFPWARVHASIALREKSVAEAAKRLKRLAEEGRVEFRNGIYYVGVMEA